MTTTFGSVLVKNRTGHPVLFFFLHISIVSTKRFFEHKKNGVKPLENKNTNHVSHMAEARLHSSLTIMISYLNLCVKKKRTGWFFSLFLVKPHHPNFIGWCFCRRVPRFQLLPNDRLLSLTIRPKPEFLMLKQQIHFLG